MMSPGGKLTALACHPTKKVNKAELLAVSLQTLIVPSNYRLMYIGKVFLVKLPATATVLYNSSLHTVLALVTLAVATIDI